MEQCDGEFAITPITIEEQMRSWLVVIRRANSSRQQVFGYEKLAGLLEYLAEFELAAFDNEAADEFDRLKRSKIRIGTMDLKIAAIALTRRATLLSANLRDFEQVPGLRVENWLD
jgi:tRNA(fMet)-specific endonuclease VapC